MDKKNVRVIYALFALEFLLLAADLSAGAFFAAAAGLLFFFDVVITSFSLFVVYTTYCCSLYAGIYAFFWYGDSGRFTRVFLRPGSGERTGRIQPGCYMRGGGGNFKPGLARAGYPHRPPGSPVNVGRDHLEERFFPRYRDVCICNPKERVVPG